MEKSGHWYVPPIGPSRTKGHGEKVEESYYWPGMKEDISTYVKQCMDCQVCKPQKAIRPPVDHRPILEGRFKDLQIDVVGPLPPSETMRYLLTVFDRTTRWIEALPMTEATSSTCCNTFLRGWVQRFGLPQIATSDNGNSFVAGLWRGLQESLGVQVSYTPLTIPVHWEGGG